MLITKRALWLGLWLYAVFMGLYGSIYLHANWFLLLGARISMQGVRIIVQIYDIIFLQCLKQNHVWLASIQELNIYDVKGDE